jgi:adenosylcobinamide amidohydrolase
MSLVPSLPPASESIMKLPLANVISETPDYIAQRHERYVVIFLKTAHRVLSTSTIHGGLVKTLRCLVNHQGMEASNHNARFEKIISLSAEQYHQSVADELEKDAALMAMMGTAASMNHVSHVHHEYRNLRVDVLVTAGVHGNALRSGDAAQWAEGENGNERVDEVGTINTIVLINQPVLPGAMCKAAMIMTEAKSSLERSSTRSVVHALERYGLTEQYLIDGLKGLLPGASYELLRDNRTAVLNEPRVVASAYAFAAVLYRLQYGTLPSTLAAEVIKDQAANVAISVSAQSDRWPDCWQSIEVSPDNLLHSFVSGVAMGWQHKW